MNYSDFTVQEFLSDEYFQDWVLQPNPENMLFWENWLAAHPHRKAEVEKARQLLGSLDLKPEYLPEPQVARIWNHLQDHLNQSRQWRIPPAAEQQKGRFRVWYQVAAVFLGLLIAGIGYWKMQPGHLPAVVVTTGYGETRRVVLPDRSVAVLNGNSELAYSGSWDAASPRQVRLQGEAYFAVTHTRDHQPFRVQLSEKVTVQVLGTRFVATSRARSTRVVLQEGKVQVEALHRSPAPPGMTRAVLKPGEMVEVQRRPYGLRKGPAPGPEAYLAFLQGKIIFKDTPLAEVARVLEDNYGYKITFSEPSLAAKRFTGSGLPNKIEMLFLAIEKSFNLEIIKHGKNLIIKRR